MSEWWQKYTLGQDINFTLLIGIFAIPFLWYFYGMWVLEKECQYWRRKNKRNQNEKSSDGHTKKRCF